MIQLQNDQPMGAEENGPRPRTPKRSHAEKAIWDPSDGNASQGIEEKWLADVSAEYALAWEQFEESGPEKTKAWADLKRLNLERWDSPNAVRRRTRLVLVTVASIAAAFGAFPEKIPFFEITINSNIVSVIVALALILTAQIFCYAAYVSTVREFLIKRAIWCAEICSKGLKVAFENRVEEFIDAQEKERVFIYNRVPKIFHFVAVSLIIGSIFWNIKKVICAN